MCGLLYRHFRTGMSYREVFSQFWKDSEDRGCWRNKRRSTVLGRWHAIKLDLWSQHTAACDDDRYAVPF